MANRTMRGTWVLYLGVQLKRTWKQRKLTDTAGHGSAVLVFTPVLTWKTGT
jgi:hypothetical protein